MIDRRYGFTRTITKKWSNGITNKLDLNMGDKITVKIDKKQLICPSS